MESMLIKINIGAREPADAGAKGPGMRAREERRVRGSWAEGREGRGCGRTGGCAGGHGDMDKGGAGGVTDWIGAAEAAQRLGIKQASLYSYVSRGILSRRTGRDGRASLFDPDEITALRRRGRPRREPGGAELVIETSLTEIAGGRLWYRGLDAAALAGTRTFEEVAGLLWTGSFAGAAAPWRATGEAIAVGSAAQSALPAGTLALERLQVIVPSLAATDPLRLQLDPPAVVAAARSLIAGLVGCLPLAGPAAPGGQSIAAQLAARLSPDPGQPGLTATVQAALVLLADHELAASTLAAPGAARAEHRLRARRAGRRGRPDPGRRGSDLRGSPHGGLARACAGGVCTQDAHQ